MNNKFHETKAKLLELEGYIRGQRFSDHEMEQLIQQLYKVAYTLSYAHSNSESTKVSAIKNLLLP